MNQLLVADRTAGGCHAGKRGVTAVETMCCGDVSPTLQTPRSAADEGVIISHYADHTVGGIPDGTDPAAHFRHVMAAVPTSVVAVGGRADLDPVVMILGSFTSVSLDPMLVGFFVGRDAARWQMLRGSDRFCVSVLDETQGWLSMQLARPGPPDLAGIEWTTSPGGAIALAGAVARFDVTPIAHHDAGDHLFVLCRVDHLEEPTGSTPLVYHEGQYRGIEIPDA